jgi:hypothetical protein
VDGKRGVSKSIGLGRPIPKLKLGFKSGITGKSLNGLNPVEATIPGIGEFPGVIADPKVALVFASIWVSPPKAYNFVLPVEWFPTSTSPNAFEFSALSETRPPSE